MSLNCVVVPISNLKVVQRRRAEELLQLPQSLPHDKKSFTLVLLLPLPVRLSFSLVSHRLVLQRKGVASDNKLIKFNLKQSVAFHKASCGQQPPAQSAKNVSYLIGRLLLLVASETCPKLPECGSSSSRVLTKLEAIKNC